MKYCQDDQRIVSHSEVNRKRKSASHRTPDIAKYQRIAMRRVRCIRDGLCYFRNELITKTGPLIVVPDRSFLKLASCRAPKYDATCHRPKRV